MSACRSCGAPILWATTANGKRMPVDADPVPDGNLVLSDPTGYAPAVALFVEGQPSLFDAPDPPRYRSHYATCPDAAAWRRDRST